MEPRNQLLRFFNGRILKKKKKEKDRVLDVGSRMFTYFLLVRRNTCDAMRSIAKKVDSVKIDNTMKLRHGLRVYGRRKM